MTRAGQRMGFSKSQNQSGIKPGGKGVFFGMCGQDMVFYTDRVPAEDKKGKSNDFEIFIGGPAANAALTFATLAKKQQETAKKQSAINQSVTADGILDGKRLSADVHEATMRDDRSDNQLDCRSDDGANRKSEYIGNDQSTAKTGETQTLLITCIGDSETGRGIKRTLQEKGVTVIDLAGEEFLTPNVSAIVINKKTGSRTIMSGQRVLSESTLKRAAEFDFASALEDASFCLYDCNMSALHGHLFAALEKEKSRRDAAEKSDSSMAVDNFCGCQEGCARRPKKLSLVLDAGSWKDGISNCLSKADEVISSAVFKSPDGEDVFDLQKDFGYLFAAKTRGGDSIQYIKMHYVENAELTCESQSRESQSKACNCKDANDGDSAICKVKHDKSAAGKVEDSEEERSKARGDKQEKFSQRGEVLPPYVEKPVDTLGAGDVFHGAYCFYRFAEGLDFAGSLEKAANVAASSITEKGPLAGIEKIKNI